MKLSSVRSITLCWLAAVVLGVLASCGGNSSGSDSAMTTATASGTQTLNTLETALTGSQEVPPTPSAAVGSGTITLDLNTNTAIATVVTTGINGTAVNVQQAAAGSNGPVVFSLTETSPSSGIWTAKATLSGDQANALTSGNMYFNVLSSAFPNGEIRGQIQLRQQGVTAATAVLDVNGGLSGTFSVTLAGSQEVPPTPSAAEGAGTALVFGPGPNLILAVTTTGITGTSAAILQGPPGTNGPLLFPLSETGPGTGIWVTNTALTPDQFNMLASGNLYINVNSAAFTGGEIRGQILSQQQNAAAVASTGTVAPVTTPSTTGGVATTTGIGTAPGVITQTGAVTSPGTPEPSGIATTTGTGTTPGIITQPGIVTTPSAATTTGVGTVGAATGAGIPSGIQTPTGIGTTTGITTGTVGTPTGINTTTTGAGVTTGLSSPTGISTPSIGTTTTTPSTATGVGTTTGTGTITGTGTTTGIGTPSGTITGTGTTTGIGTTPVGAASPTISPI